MEVQIGGRSAFLQRLSALSAAEKGRVARVVLSFFDLAATATARATFYNSKSEQVNAVHTIHDELLAIDRGLYAAALLLPGLTDFNKQVAILRMLAQPYDSGLLTAEQEALLLAKLILELPVQRRLNVFLDLKNNRVNNSRSRKFILTSILPSARLVSWAVKYRGKLAAVLEHAWGKRGCSILAAILAKPRAEWNSKEQGIVRDRLLKYLDRDANEQALLESIGFILGNEKNLHEPLLTAYVEAKQDLSKGRRLPYEVLEGIRSTYHKNVSSSTVLELTKAQLTKGQRLALQRKAAEAQVELQFNPFDYDPVRLYIYAYERGMTEDIARALEQKAQAIAASLPQRYENIVIIVDNSMSMTGSDSQRLRPIAVALAVRDVLRAASSGSSVLYSSPAVATETMLPRCEGHTALAELLLAGLRSKVDAVFVISDGYENATAGRFNEVMHLVRGLGIRTPVFQVNPVMAAEAIGLRRLSAEIALLPVSDPQALGVGMIRGLLEADLELACRNLLEYSLPLLN